VRPFNFSRNKLIAAASFFKLQFVAHSSRRNKSKFVSGKNEKLTFSSILSGASQTESWKPGDQIGRIFGH
jgi:hypothetical protein